MRTIRRTIAALMILLLMISALPVKAFAQTAEGSGAEDSVSPADEPLSKETEEEPVPEDETEPLVPPDDPASAEPSQDDIIETVTEAPEDRQSETVEEQASEAEKPEETADEQPSAGKETEEETVPETGKNSASEAPLTEGDDTSSAEETEAEELIPGTDETVSETEPSAEPEEQTESITEETEKPEETDLTEDIQEKKEEEKEDVPDVSVPADEDGGTGSAGDPADAPEDGAGETDPSEPQEEKEHKIYALTLVIGDIRDDVRVYRNGKRISWIISDPSPGDGSFFLAEKTGFRKLEKEADGMTRVVLEAEKGDVFRIVTIRQPYASVRFTNALVIREFDAGKVCDFTAGIEDDTWILMDADYSKAAGYYDIPLPRRALKRSDPNAPVLPDSIYVTLGDKYDDYSGSAMINGHTGVWYFEPDDPEGLYVSAACGNTSKKMVTGMHYKVCRISEAAAKEYLDYGDGCCPPRTQRALAWITHHGQAEYDWRIGKEGTGKIGDGKIEVSSHLEAYTITFLASWVCTNDGREGPYGTVHSEDGAVALDAMFSSEFSTGLPASTKSAIDRMVSMAFAFADKFTDGDDPEIDEYMDTYIYSDGDAVHQPLLIGAYRGHSHGYLKVRKTSEIPAVTDGNSCYSLAGTVFSVKDSSGTEVGTLTSDENGETEVLELEPGTYTVTEVTAGTGYVRNVTVNTVEVVSYETAETGFINSPVFDPAGMHLAKWDREADSFVPQGESTFSGAEYRLEYFPNYSWSGTPERSWVFRTDENGSIRYLPAYKVSGDDLFEYMGAYFFPLGSIRITEVKAPAGYLMSTDVLYATVERNGDRGRFSWTTETLGLIKAFSDGTGVPEKIIKGGVAIRKADAETGKSIPQGNAKLSGAEYTVYAGKDMQIDGKAYKNGDAVLIIVTGTDGIARTDNRALPYGSYYLRETKAPEGYLIDETRKDFMVESDGSIVDLTGDRDVSLETVIKGGVAIRKADAVTGQSVPQGEAALAGAEYTVYTANEMHIGEKKYAAGEAVLTMVTTEDGTAGTSSNALPYGSYYLIETKAPEGYLINEERKDFRITSNGVITDLTTGADVSLEMPVRGGVSIRKTDAVTGKSVPQGDAKLLGAEFTVYAAKDMNIEGKQYRAGDPLLTITTGPDGTAKTGANDLVYGSYYIKETKAPEGYLLNEERKDFRVTEDGEIVDLTSDTNAVRETPIRGGARFRKVDLVTGGEPQGCGTLQGAEITIYNSSERLVIVEGTEIAPGEPVCVIVTDESGYAATEDMILPYGTYTARETKASEGYFLNEDWSVTFSIRDEGQTIDLTSEEHQLKEQVIRGDLTLLKLDVDGTPMANIPFMIEALDKEGNVAEKHVMVTDDRGRLDTSSASRKHSNLTNSLDGYTDGAVFSGSSKLDPAVGVWFGAGEPDDSLGALPYGAYRVYELQSEETAGMQINLLQSGIVILDGDHLEIDFGAMVDLSVSLESDASCADTGLNIVPVTDNARVTDTVRYWNLTAGRRYTMETRFVLASDILREIGRAETDFMPDTGEYGKTTSSGYVTVNEVLDTSGYAGETLVAFDRLYEYVDGKKVLIAVHEDPDDTRQMLRIPDIGTTAMDTDTKDHVGTVSEASGITDTVRYTNLRKGEMFRLTAVLADPETGEALRDRKENIYTADKYFICGQEKGEITMPEIIIDSTGLAGGSAVVQEKLYLVKEGEEILMATHEDLADKEQTVTWPQVRTTATGKETGEHIAPVSEKTVIEDRVILKGLIPGKGYVLEGKLVYKEEYIDCFGEQHMPGEVIETASLAFTAEAAEQEIILTFEADSRMLEGTCAVVFEDLIYNGVKVASHADLDDEEQTVWFPSVMTWASDRKSGTQFVTKGENTVLRDTVQLTGLHPGSRYKVKGQLFNRYTGEPMTAIAESGVFTAGRSSMEVTVDIAMDTSGMNCFTGVMFEKLYLVRDDGSEILLSSHEDISDEDQALYMPDIATTATDSLSGTHEAQARENATVIDEVRYSDLMPLETYTLEGILVYADTGEPVIADGKTLTVTKEFCPEYPDGTIYMTFLFDAGELAGRKTVVFEKLNWNGRVIASHQDLTDEKQTVNFIDIGTYAKDPDTNTKYLGLDHEVRILDTVRYTGLTPGKIYTLRGSLMYADDGVPVAQNGEPVCSETQFVPGSPDGEAEVEFILDTTTIPGERLVVYERLFAGSSTQNEPGKTSPIAVHEELSDDGQTVYVPELPEEPVDTGDRGDAKAGIAMALASAAGICWVMTADSRRRRMEKKREDKRLTKRA